MTDKLIERINEWWEYDTDSLMGDAKARILADAKIIKAAEELADAVHKEHVARGNYIATKTDRGGSVGPKGQARHDWFDARCKAIDALAAYRAAVSDRDT